MANRSVTVALITLVTVNVIVAAAWLLREPLLEAGVLSPAVPLPSEVVLPAQPLPPAAGQGEVDAVAQPAPAAPPAANAAPAESPPSRAMAPPAVPTSLPPEPSVAASSPGTAFGGTGAAPECMLAGPVTGRDSAAQIQADVEAKGGEAGIEAVRLAPRYLVHLAPTISSVAARLARDALVASGVSAYVIPNGERRNGVSVGVFSTPERAAAQRDRVADLGYDDVRVSTVERPAERYRLRVYGVAPAVLGATAWKPCPGPDVDRDASQEAQ